MRFLLAIFFLFIALHPLAARAAPPAPLLLLPDTGQQVSASGHMLLLRDPRGELGPAAALASPGWRALPGAVSAGYTDDVLWLLLDVRRAADAPDITDCP